MLVSVNKPEFGDKEKVSGTALRFGKLLLCDASTVKMPGVDGIITFSLTLTDEGRLSSVG